MVAVLALLLFLHGALTWAQEAAPGRVLVLPDVTLSAEDPLYLAIPPAAGWTLRAPAQPDPDRRRLWAVDVPPRIRGLRALPPLPDSAPFPGSAPRPSGALRDPVVIPPQPRPGPEATAAAARAAGEAGLRLLYRPNTTVGLDLWLERRRGAWEAAGSAAITVSEEMPSWFEARASSALERETWRGSLRAEGQGLRRPQTVGFVAGGLSAELQHDPAPWGVHSVTNLRAEQPADAGDAWLLLSQGVSGTWQGERWGLHLSGMAIAVAADNPALRGLARAGLEWAGRPLTVSTGASLLASENSLRPYPEAALELRLRAPFRLQAGLGAYLEEPAPFLVRETFGGGVRPELLPAAGLTAYLAAVLDTPRSSHLGIRLQAFDGQHLLLRDELLRLEDSPLLAAAALARLAVNAGDRRRPRLVLSAEGSAGIRLPISAQAFDRPLYAGAGAGMEVGFANCPVELILQARWGEVPVDGLPALIAERQAAIGRAALTVRYSARPRLTVDGGLELREAGELGGLAACTLRVRRSP
jgi:hypothetical protein